MICIANLVRWSARSSAIFVLGLALPLAAAAPPNVVLVITDDQGYGDLGCHGNPDLKTPHLDRLAAQSVHLRTFYVSPVCAPTRAALMTGRYNYRTGVTDTFLGRAMMRPGEVTLAEMFSKAGYRTGIFGKWHLGDNAPLRALDQGFEESLVLKGGGIGQPSDPPGGESYFDPLLLHNGTLQRHKGYCSDVFTTAAIEFIESQAAERFFVYLPFNAPHSPLQVPEADVAPYRNQELSAGPHKFEGKLDQDTTARVYGMVANIDANMGRLLAKLDALGLAENTIVIFLTDNGPQQPRFVAGLRGRKGSVYDGGVRVPCYVRWTGTLPAGRAVDAIAAHIDLLPTLAEACSLPAVEEVKLDGRSLWPLLQADVADWPERTLFMQWHRGDEPQLFRAFAVRTPRWKLVQARGVPPGPFDERPALELFDMRDDPAELRNVAADHPEIVNRLREEYVAWFRDVGAAGFAPPRIHLGSSREDPVTLTRQDWRGPRAGWNPTDLGSWEVEIVQAGRYHVTARFPKGSGTEATLELAGASTRVPIDAAASEIRFGTLELPVGPTRLTVSLTSGTDTRGPQQVEVHRLP